MPTESYAKDSGKGVQRTAPMERAEECVDYLTALLLIIAIALFFACSFSIIPQFIQKTKPNPKTNNYNINHKPQIYPIRDALTLQATRSQRPSLAGLAQWIPSSS